METLTEHFERCIADFLRRTRLTSSQFGERAIGDRKFCETSELVVYNPMGSSVIRLQADRVLVTEAPA